VDKSNIDRHTISEYRGSCKNYCYNHIGGDT